MVHVNKNYNQNKLIVNAGDAAHLKNTGRKPKRRTTEMCKFMQQSIHISFYES